ncbi:carbohydrate porin [Accumulibacter sp.]|uniref:carbohydrate porin n=1 Tax=Accumulibacter sp. TaxID=2053492 RepID=UPI0025D43EB1|nr:carbohydrate porin [Accumulibacter sp.]MCM8624564.1 carbohydrate porin [Accumulibacter sp.]
MSVESLPSRPALGALLVALLALPAPLALAVAAEPPVATAIAEEGQATDEEEASTEDRSPAEAAPDWSGTTLSGDWAGTRRQLYDAGVQADLGYTGDYLYNTTGGLKRGGAYVSHADLILQFDGEKLFGWKGGSAYLHVIGNGGGRPNSNYVGSLMGVDNFEAPANRTGIFKAWLQQSFLDDKASLRVGLYPIDSEFYVTESSGIFLHPSFGMAAEAAYPGTLAAPSIYATSSWGARLRVDPDPSWYAMLAVTRGVTSDRLDSAGPNLSWSRSTGSMVIGELGFSPLKAGLLGAAEKEGDAGLEPISKVAVGAWRYAPRFPQITAVDANGDPQMATHWGAYVLAEQSVYAVPAANRDLAVFARYGFTDGRTDAINYSLSVGLNLRGPLAGRDKDSVGLAMTRGHVDSQGREQIAADALTPVSGTAETAIELTYRAQIVPGFSFQPVVQRIVNPGLYLPNSTVAGARLQFAL